MTLCLMGLGGPAQAATTITTTTSFDYDPATGLLKKMVVEPGDSTLCLVTEITPDAYGHPQTTTTRNCNGSAATLSGAPSEAPAPAPTDTAAFLARISSNSYSPDQRFVTTTTNALSHSETKTYDARFGTVATLKGPNLLTTRWTYDGLGRKTLETRADGTQTKWTYVFCTWPGYPTWTWPAAPVGATTATCDTVPARFTRGGYSVGPSNIRPIYYVQATPLKPDGFTPNGAYARVYYDTLGREIRTETQGFDGSGSSPIVYQDTQYDLAGTVGVTTLPYSPGTTPRYAIGYAYDVLGRVTMKGEGDAAGGPALTRTSYSGLRTTVTDPKGYPTTQLKNAAGQVTQITDAKGGTLIRAYDPLGHLVRTTDAKGNVISMVYDKRGRKTAMYDPDMGVWNYAYNAAGDLVRQTDAKLQVTTQSYDKLGRLIGRSEPDLTSAWAYDRYADSSPCSQGIGKLCEATADNGYRRKHSYDSLGRASSVTTFVNSTSYIASLGFDASTGRVNSQTYPTGLTVNTTYTPLGYPKQLIDARNSSALWTATSQDAQGHLLQTKLGNGLVTTNTYFKDGRLNTTRTGPGNAVQNLLYGYDLNRNISTRFDVGTGVTASYAYDELNRLSSESRSGGALGSTQVMAWTYDAIGNLASRTESGNTNTNTNTNTYNYNASGLGSRRPHAVGSVSGSVSGVLIPTYRYDDNGNLISGAGRTVAWTSANMAKTVSAGTAQLNFHYSPEHERVKETYTRSGALQRTTVYINPGAGEGIFYEEDSGVAGTKRKHYITAGGATVAVIVCTATPCTNTANSSTQYWHEDHLGSVAVVTNAAGAVVERMAYEPFGKRRNSNGVTDVNGTLVPSSTDRGYTEQEHMDEVALINLNGRIYDPGLGRFMSADPTIPYPNATQSYNRYSYGRNNPLRMFDPSGFTDYDFGDAGGCLSCAPTSNGGGYASPGSIGSFSMLPGELTWFSTGAVGDPLASFAGNTGGSFGGGVGGLGTFGSTTGVTSFLGDVQFGESAIQFGRKITADFVDNNKGSFGFQGWLAEKLEGWVDRPDASTPSGQVGAVAAAIAPFFLPGPKGGAAAKDAQLLLNGPIKITENGLAHVVERHTVNDIAKFAGKSKFNEGESLSALINQGVQQQMVQQANGNFARTYDVGRQVGIDRMTGGQTSVMTVITRPNGELVTAFPGRP